MGEMCSGRGAPHRTGAAWVAARNAVWQRRSLTHRTRHAHRRPGSADRVEIGVAVDHERAQPVVTVDDRVPGQFSGRGTHPAGRPSPAARSRSFASTSEDAVSAATTTAARAGPERRYVVRGEDAAYATTARLHAASMPVCNRAVNGLPAMARCAWRGRHHAGADTGRIGGGAGNRPRQVILYGAGSRSQPGRPDGAEDDRRARRRSRWPPGG